MSYSSNQLRPEYPVQDRLAVYIVPAWIYRAFTSRFNLVDIHNYGKLRSVLSATDLAQLELCQWHVYDKAFPANGMMSGNDLCGSFIGNDHRNTTTITEEEQREARSTIRFLMDDPSVLTGLMERLCPTPVPDEDCYPVECSNPIPVETNKTEASVPYRVVLLNDSLYIHMEEGALSYLKGKAEKLTFLTQVLKSAYAIAPIRVVNSSGWYQQYLAALAAS